MAKNQTKKVIVTPAFEFDLSQVYEYGQSTFGHNVAQAFVNEIYGLVMHLDRTFLHYPECRFLATKRQMYRNIVLESYLIIYRITSQKIEVLRILHGSMAIEKLQEARKVTA